MGPRWLTADSIHGKPALTLSSHPVAQRIAKRGWISDASGDIALVPRVVTFATSRKLTNARIGVAGMRWIIGAGVLADLRTALPLVEFVDADQADRAARMIRSALEIQQILELWDLSKALLWSALLRLFPLARAGWRWRPSAHKSR